jgi:formylglycine-generating enzyme required for sulfatase activity
MMCFSKLSWTTVLLLLPTVFASGQTPSAGAMAGSKQLPRRALLIANSSYSNLPHVPAASQELAMMRSALTDAGFELSVIENAGVSEFAAAVQSFYKKVQQGDVCLLYFTGYAIQHGGVDFLLPTDFLQDDPTERSYSVAAFAKGLEGKASLKLIFLEAARHIDVQVQDAPGLLSPDLSRGITQTLIGLPAATNQVVQTSLNQPGLFTRALTEEIRKKGLSIFQLMPEVRNAVAAASRGQQQPAEVNNLTREFYFHEPDKPGPMLGIPQQNHTDREQYVWIPAGKFLMGCVPGNKCEKNEMPQHPVTISKPFWMGQNEVRVISYKKFVDADRKHRKMPAGPFWDKKWNQEDRPISDVRWQEAVDYCRWAGGRLPTEAEWERAARAGVDNQVYPLNDENSRDKANFRGKKGNDIFEDTAPVKSFDPLLPYQLFDMAGNVWEFVSDFYKDDYYQHSPPVDPKGPDSGKEHVVRGGSFDSDPQKHLRISFREPKDHGNNIGFRCVLDDTPETHELLQIP